LNLSSAFTTLAATDSGVRCSASFDIDIVMRSVRTANATVPASVPDHRRLRAEAVSSAATSGSGHPEAAVGSTHCVHLLRMLYRRVGCFQMKNDEPTLPLSVMNEAAYGEKIVEFLLANPRDRGCVEISFSDRAGAHTSHRFFHSWATPEAAAHSSKRLAERVHKTSDPWEIAALTIKNMPPHK
jgi:hypothetical protein